MNALRRFQIALLIAVIALSGCAGPWSETHEVPSGQVRREVTIDVTADAIENEPTTLLEALASMVNTSLVYVHAGPTIDISEMMVAYIDEAGAEVTEDLSTHTKRTTISAGDEVRIDGVAMFSTINVSAAGLPLAVRTGLPASWFTENELPLPFDATPDAQARWAISFLDRFSGSIDVVGGEIEGEPIEATAIDMGMEARLDAWLTWTTSRDARNTFVELDLAVDPWSLVGSAGLQAEVEAEGGDDFSESFGFEADAHGEMDFLARLTFGMTGDLKRLGHSIQAGSGGHVRYWAVGSTPEEPVDFLNETAWPTVDKEYSENAVPGDPDAEIDDLATLLALYEMDLALGDRFTLLVDVADEEFPYSMRSTTTVIVAEETTRPVGGVDLPVFRLDATASIESETPQLGKQSVAGQTLRQWVTRDSFLPVEIRSGGSSVLEPGEWSELQEYARTIAEDVELNLTLWNLLEANSHMDLNITMTNVTGDMRLAAIATVGTLLNIGTTWLGLGVLFADADQTEVSAAPQVTFAVQGSDDPVIHVVSVDSGVLWSDLAVTGPGCQAPASGEVTVDQTITSCEAGQRVQIFHKATSTLYFSQMV